MQKRLWHLEFVMRFATSFRRCCELVNVYRNQKKKQVEKNRKGDSTMLGYYNNEKGIDMAFDDCTWGNKEFIESCELYKSK